MKTFKVTAFLLIIFSAVINAEKPNQKNIVFILTDDLGFNDPSFRGNNEILTPNIDALFYEGVALNRYYTAPLCTPTRASLLTGHYAHRIGMQNEVIWNHQAWGLPLDQKLMPQYLKEVGYATHAIGKWHLGFFRQQYTPTRRGFDSFFGSLGTFVDYYNRTFQLPASNFGNFNITSSLGYDFRNNLDVDYSDMNMYITDLLTKRTVDIIENSDDKPFFIYLAHTAMHRANDFDPLPVKQEDFALYDFIQNNERRHYAAMVKSVDDSVGEVVEALSRSGKLKDTIIVFTTDNGGPTMVPLVNPNTASNYPLKGMKGLAWEGGIRVDCGIYAPWLPAGVKRENYFHVSDWLPTLASLANTGIEFDRVLDGMDLSKMITKGESPYRQDIETIDQYYGTSSLIHEDFKLVNSSYRPFNGAIDIWMGTNNNADRESNTYIERVLNSKVALNLKRFGNGLNENKINRYREGLKVSCNNQPVVPCDIMNKRCLFKIHEDPCERNNLADDPAYESMLNDMIARLEVSAAQAVPRRNVGDRRGALPASDPSNFNGIWTWWENDA